MKTLLILIAMCAPAYAWDGPGMWYRPANDDNPGGGGILGTGGGHDHGIKCTDCHVNRANEPDLAFDLKFNPPITDTYAPGTIYQVTATLSNARLGQPCNMQYTSTVDNFAASFEDDSGALAGALASDSGQTSANCGASGSGSTQLAGDCAVIFSSGAQNVDTWTFSWTAPAGGSVHIYYGAVDGDCDMMSMGDAAVTGQRTLQAQQFASNSPWKYGALVMIGLVACCSTRRWRSPKPSSPRSTPTGAPRTT